MGNITLNDKFLSAKECLDGKALTEYNGLINDGTEAFRPVNTSNRSDAQFNPALKDLCSKLHDHTCIGNQLLQIVQAFKWDGMKADLDQCYPDKSSNQEARIDDIIQIAQTKVNLRGNVPTNYERMNSL